MSLIMWYSMCTLLLWLVHFEGNWYVYPINTCMLGQCWPYSFIIRPALCQYWSNLLCLLGAVIIYSSYIMFPLLEDYHKHINWIWTAHPLHIIFMSFCTIFSIYGELIIYWKGSRYDFEGVACFVQELWASHLFSLIFLNVNLNAHYFHVLYA